MLTPEKPPQSSGIITSTTPETECVDTASWSESDFEEKCTYVVKDHPLEEESESTSKTRAERSLPRNLTLRHCPKSAEVQIANEERLGLQQLLKRTSIYADMFASHQQPSIHLSILRQELLYMLKSNFSLSPLLRVLRPRKWAFHQY